MRISGKCTVMTKTWWVQPVRVNPVSPFCLNVRHIPNILALKLFVLLYLFIKQSTHLEHEHEHDLRGQNYYLSDQKEIKHSAQLLAV